MRFINRSFSFTILALSFLVFARLTQQEANASNLSPERVLKRICEEHAEHTAFAKSWIDPKVGVNIILRNGKIKNEPGFKILDSLFFEWVEGRHEIKCPGAFSQNQVICRKSAGGEAYRYVFQESKGHYFLTTINVEFEE